ncbi:MAG: RnfABCDGE type electron transport complex subunit G [Gammaproteobacteria bacterium]
MAETPDNQERGRNLRQLVFLVVLGGALTGILAWVYQDTLPRALMNQEAHAMRTLREVLPEGKYDNEPHRDKVFYTDADLLGSSTPQPVYIARDTGKPVAIVVNTRSSPAYIGPVTLVVGISASGEIIGVRAVDHQETPGLGDNIDVAKSDWIKEFRDRSLANTVEGKWNIRRNGGDFDQISGATVTSHAVINAVYQALQFEAQHRAEIYEQDLTKP